MIKAGTALIFITFLGWARSANALLSNQIMNKIFELANRLFDRRLVNTLKKLFTRLHELTIKAFMLEKVVVKSF
jgi:hypothetical protein